MRRPIKITAGLLIAAALLAACGARSVNQILADPSRYSRKSVTLKGRVTESYSILGKGAYQIDDGTGKIWVVSAQGVPREGAQVSVKGTVREAFNLGSSLPLPKNLDAGVVLVESSHKASD